jgi:hypothetical protein
MLKSHMNAFPAVSRQSRSGNCIVWLLDPHMYVPQTNKDRVYTNRGGSSVCRPIDVFLTLSHAMLQTSCLVAPTL